MTDTTTRTARDRVLEELTDPKEWGANVLGMPKHMANAYLDAHREQVLAEFRQGDAREILARHRHHVLTEAAAELDRIADEVEARVAEYYGRSSGIGPGSADMVREAARTVRSLAARTTTTQEQ
jgi:hypothetical protein